MNWPPNSHVMAARLQGAASVESLQSGSQRVVTPVVKSEAGLIRRQSLEAEQNTAEPSRQLQEEGRGQAFNSSPATERSGAETRESATTPRGRESMETAPNTSLSPRNLSMSAAASSGVEEDKAIKSTKEISRDASNSASESGAVVRG
jgi:hypothetical protein